MGITNTVKKIWLAMKTFNAKDLHVVEPFVTFDLDCAGVRSLSDVTERLPNPSGTNALRIKCPRCEQTYNLRIKKNVGVGEEIAAGRLHVFMINKINRQTKKSFV